MGITSGYGGDHLKNTMSVLLNNYHIRIPKIDFDKNIHKHYRENTVCVKTENGNKIISKDSIEYTKFKAFNYGRRLLQAQKEKQSKRMIHTGQNRGGKNPRSLYVIVFDQSDEVFSFSHGGIIDMCKNNGLPLRKVMESYKNKRLLYEPQTSFKTNKIKNMYITATKKINLLTFMLENSLKKTTIKS